MFMVELDKIILGYFAKMNFLVNGSHGGQIDRNNFNDVFAPGEANSAISICWDNDQVKTLNLGDQSGFFKKPNTIFISINARCYQQIAEGLAREVVSGSQYRVVVQGIDCHTILFEPQNKKQQE